MRTKKLALRSTTKVGASRGPTAKGVDKWGDRTNYAPTDVEKAAVDQVRRKLREAPCLASLKAVKQPGGKSKLIYDHPHQTYAMARTIEAIGCGDARLTDNLVRQLANLAVRDGEISERDLNFAMGIVQNIAPTDGVEALLAVQMAAAHIEAMRAANRLAQSTLIPQQDSSGAIFGRLSRLFTEQAETLKKLRSSGVQTISVEHRHVHVHVKGEEARGGGLGKIERRPHAPLGGDAAIPAVLREDEANRKALPRPSCERLESVPDARSARRRANGSAKRQMGARP